MMTKEEIFKFFEDKEEWKFYEEDDSVFEEFICFQKVLISGYYNRSLKIKKNNVKIV